MKFLSKRHVMVDLETLSTQSDAVILSIGAVAFDFNDGLGSEFYVNVDAEDGRRLGLHIAKDAVQFWAKQPKHVLKALYNPDPVSVQDALTSFFEWYKEQDAKYIWSHGTCFDIPIIGYAALKCGLSAPYKYWDVMDNRTVMNILDLRTSTTRKGDEDLHNALADAKAQALVLIDAFKDA